jgi:FKBP-type peptidyl-prolyl cis-trans isomerase 2
VTVNYVGRFEDGRVFDTSIKAVAEDNNSYPKAISYQPKASYEPFSFTIGSGEVVRGFDQNVIGMREGETRIITIPPELGYGSPDPRGIEVRPLVETLKQWEEISAIDFQVNFSAIAPKAPEKLRIVEPEWGWNVTVFPTNTDSKVLIVREAVNNSLVRPFGAWDARVTEVDSGRNVIRIEHLLSPAHAGRIIVREVSQSFMVTEVDESTFTIDRNPEVVGKTLIFEVTVVTITKPGEGSTPLF